MSTTFRLLRGPRAYAIMSVTLLVLAIASDRFLTRGMATHMLVHIPLILFSGISACAALRCSRFARTERWKRGARSWSKYNEQGVPGLLLGTLLAACWMIPKALDDVLLSWPVALWKYVGLFIAGLVLFDALPRANSVIKLFFLGNFSWMMAIAGLLYQDDTSRLCNAYLLNDQELTGKGLVVLAVAVPAVWLWSERSRLGRLMSK